MDLLRDRLRPVAPDLPGFGFSPPPAGDDYSLRGHARAVTELVERVGARTTGAPDGQLARRHRLDRRCRDPAGPGAHADAGVTRAAGAAAPAEQRAPAGARGAVGRAAAGQAAGPLPGRAAGARHHRALLGRPVAGAARAVRGRDDRGGPAGSPRARRRRDDQVAAQPDDGVPAPGPVAAVAAGRPGAGPTLLVYGLKDRLVDPRTASRAARTFPDNRMLLLPDSGHVSQMEHPGAVAAAIRRLVETSSSRTP